MRPASDQFLASLRQSHVIAAACELLFPGAAEPVPVPIEAGEVRIDRTAQSRRAGTIQIPWSLSAAADLDLDLRTLTLGGYAIVKRGLRYANGSTELITLGTLRVESVTWQTLEASASLELADRMAQVRDEPFVAPYSALGQRPADAAIQIVRDVFGDAISYQKPFDPPGPLGDVTYSGARTEALSGLEQGYGAETYFDADGAFVFDEKPGDSEAVVWSIETGAQGVMVDASENLDRTGIYNGVLVKGQAAADQPPVSALATFDNPESPIRWGGPFGKVALLADSTTVSTVEQAASTAQSLLRLRLKQTRSLELTSAPNPALEAGDTIQILFPDGRDERHLIDAVITGLGTEAQRIVTRSQFAPTLALAPVTDRLFYGAQAWREIQDAVLV
jgi:Domain of unknown function (DUF5047)